MKKHKRTKEIDRLRKEIEEWRNKYLRALADYHNLEKRVKVEKENEARFAARNLTLKLLSVYDLLEKAGRSLKDHGLQLVIDQFRDILRSEYVEKIEVLGKQFDPSRMECVDVVESSKEGVVVDEIRSGYSMRDKVIRVAQVKVGKRSIDKKKEEST